MKRLAMLVGLLLVVCLLVPVSCAKAPPPPAPMPAPAPAPRPAPVPAPSVEMPPREEVVYKETGAGALPPTEERMIVRTGEMSLVVEAVVDARDEIAQLAVRLDGYVVSTRI